MTLIHRLKAVIRHFLAIRRREKLRRHAEALLHQLDDAWLADIGVLRGCIAEVARRTAYEAVPIPPVPGFGRKSILAALRSWREKRFVTAALGSLDDRLLRDIGIEPSGVRHAGDPLLSLRRDLGTPHPSDRRQGAMPEIRSPVCRERPGVPATPLAEPSSMLEARAANDNQSFERGPRASVGR